MSKTAWILIKKYFYKRELRKCKDIENKNIKY